MTDDQARVDASADHNNNDNNDSPAKYSESPGKLLREGRERLNLSIADVSERLRLRQQIIIDLEQDQYSKYVANTFTRGYLRSYARLLNLDDETVISAYESFAPQDQPQSMQSFSQRTKQQSHDNKLMLVTYIVGAVVIGSAVIFWAQNNGHNNDVANRTAQPTLGERLVEEQDVQVDVEGESATSDTSLREPIFIDTTVVDPDRLAQHQAQNTADEIETVVEEPEADEGSSAGTNQSNDDVESGSQAEQQTSSEAAPVTEQQSSATEAQSLPDADLVLVFSGDAWIRIEDANGDAIAFGVKPDGHVSALDGDAPFHVTLGAPENVTMYYQGQAIDLSSFRAGRVARITVPDTE